MQVRKKGDSLQIKTAVPLTYLPMSEMRKARQSGANVPDSLFTNVPLNQWVEFKTTTSEQKGAGRGYEITPKHSRKPDDLKF